ncbi:MAG: hypothetical protein M3Y36_00175 [Actinomycetota bacterium]|nr:hypothetical protein [Actinomycetota bacterium]
MVTVAVGDDLEIRPPAGQVPDANDIGDANPAILQRDPTVTACRAPACLSFRVLAAGQTMIIFAQSNSCGLPGEATCPPGAVTIPLVVFVRATG